jgi:hypothetical protein
MAHAAARSTTARVVFVSFVATAATAILAETRHCRANPGKILAPGEPPEEAHTVWIEGTSGLARPVADRRAGYRWTAIVYSDSTSAGNPWNSWISSRIENSAGWQEN